MDEENSNNYRDNANVILVTGGILTDTGNDNTGIISEGNVLSVDSNKADSDIIGAESKNKTQAVTNVVLKDGNKGSGDTSRNLVEENLVKCDKIESELDKMTEESDSNPEKCSGDFLSKVSNESTKKIDLNDENITFNEATASKSVNIDKHDAALDSHINKSDETDSKMHDVGLQGDEDDDMKLTWEDDDTGDQITDNTNEKSDKPLEILSEEQLLEENDTETEVSDINLTLKKTEPDSSFETVTTSSPKKKPEEEKGDKCAEKSIEATSLVKTDNLVSSDIDPKIGNMEKSDLLESLKIALSPSQMSSEETVPEKKAISDQNDVKDDEILAESDNIAEEVITEVENIEKSDDLLLEDQLLEDTEENDTGSDKIPITNVPLAKDLDKINDIVLEETLLKEASAETAEIIPEADVSMTVIDDDEKELLKDDELQEKNTAMDVDSSDLLIDDQTRDNIHLPANNQDEIEENDDDSKIKHDEFIPVDNQAKLEDKNEETTTSDQSEIKDLPVIDEKSNLDPKSVDKQIDKNEQTIDIPIETEQIDANTDIKISSDKPTIEKEILERSTNDTEVEVESILEPEKVPSTDITESNNEDGDINESNISSICPEDSPFRNQTHGLHKPDVMLEIPTQELIDIDTDLSMNLDQTNDIDSPNTEQKISNSIATEKPENNSIAELNVDKNETDNTVVDCEKEKKMLEKAEIPVVQKTIEEHLEQMFTDIEPESKEAEEDSATSHQPQQLSVQPSPSFTMTPDTSDEMPEVSDSLGLLAESSGRVMEDDEEPDDDDDGEDDDDFDQDESSNLVSAEQSEDSNPPASELEPVRDQEEKEMETPESQEMQFDFTINNVECSVQEKADKMEIEVEEYGTLQLQAESIDDEETKSAVKALLKDVEGDSSEQFEEPNDTTEQMDIETVKLSDTSDNEAEETTQVLQEHTIEDEEDKSTQSPSKQSPNKQSPNKQSPSKQSQIAQSPSKQSQIAQSPSKLQKLAITTLQASNDVNIVDLEESSSSEDDIQEIKKPSKPETTQEDKSPSPDPEGVTKVNIPTGIDVMCTSGGNTSDIVTKEGEVVISGIPKPPPQKPARLNTGEVTIKTATASEPLVIPETKITEQTQPDAKAKPKLSLEIFSLDSDDDDGATKETPTTTSPHKMTALELEKARETSKCINYCCTSGKDVPYIVADAATVAYYDAGRKRRSMVCQPCAEVVTNRTKNLIQGIKNLTPLLDLEMGKMSQDLVEISDSESEDEDMTPDEPKESIGEKGAKFLEENLAQLLNETWHKYDMDCRLTETQIMLDDEIAKLEQDSKEIDAMLNECQAATDKLRSELYGTFEHRRVEQPAIVLYDTPEYSYVGREIIDATEASAEPTTETRQAKRRLSSSSETVAKRPAIPLGYAPLDLPDNSSIKDQKTSVLAPDTKLDDDKDISVVKLSAESAPADLPPPGEISRPPLRVGMPVYAMKNAFGPWLKGKILEIQSKNPAAGNPFSLCRVKFDHKAKTNGKILPARCVAYAEPADVRMTIGTRLIALFKDANKRESYYSGVVAEIPNPVNNYRYLVFFDDGYAQYVQHGFTKLVCESSPLVWEEVHPFSREFVREYLLAYPERPMVRLHEGQHLKTEWNGKWWSSRVIKVDASLAQVVFVGDGRREWIYRGSTRLAPLYLELRAAERHRPRPMPRSKAQPRSNMPYVEYTRSDEPEPKQTEVQVEQQQQQNEEIRRQRAVAKKSTSVPQPAPPPQQQVASNLDTVTSRVVYYTPKNAVKPYRMTPHKCGPKCKRSDVLSLKELRTYNPLAKPLLSGWERQIVRYKGHKEVMYRAPCGRRVRSLAELHNYLRRTDSELPVDLFDFHHATHCLAEFVLNKCLVGKKDLSHGKENVPVPCVNYYDESLPEFCSYNTERTPTAGVPLNLDPEFLCGCDCTDDCQDKTKCACWKMTLEGARTIGLDGPNVGYVYKRLPEPLPSGIYECNSRCKCKHTCLNRVAQHPLQLKLQVFKTPNRGWGIRALNDVPKGSFLCVYAGNLLTDATANLDGLNEGDEYLAELDYIEVVEQMKEGYEEDIPEADKKLDKKDQGKDDDDADEPSSSEDDEAASKSDKEDDDFRPGYIGLGVQEFSKRLRRRERSKKDKDDRNQKEKDDGKQKEKEKEKETKDPNGEEDCITISDDEEVREPSRFTVQAGMGAGEFISKYKSVRTLFGKDEACYIMDAKVQGNIGRYLNHSCCPNVFVQNVFVDTHDPRFPWVAFFALSHIKAGTELTWNYNYDVGSVPGKILYCYCGAVNCRGRLL